MKKGIKKFLTICAAAVGIGAIMSIAGIAAGGLEGIDKLPEKYSWIKGNTGQMEYEYLGEESFTSIKVVGDMDVKISGGAENESTRVGAGENVSKPEMRVEKGVLIIDGTKMYDKGIDLGIGGDNVYPTAEIYCPEGSKLEKVEVKVSYGEIFVSNIHCREMEVISDNGDVEINDVENDIFKADLGYGDLEGGGIASGGFHAKLETGDCDVKGSFTGNTDIVSEYGDVSLFTSFGEEMYTVDVDTEAGSLEVGEKEFDNYSNSYSSGNGSDIIEINSQSGDVDIEFGKQR